MKFDDTTRVHLPCALADANWVDLCQQLTIYIPEDLKQDLRWSRYKLFKKQINFQDYLEHTITTNNNDDPNVSKVNTWYEEGLSVFTHIYRELKEQYKEILIKQILGIKYSKNYNPLREWFDFQELMIHDYDYDLATNSLITFLFEAKIQTGPLIRRDINRYFEKFDKNIFEYIKPLLVEKKKLYYWKKIIWNWWTFRIESFIIYIWKWKTFTCNLS